MQRANIGVCCALAALTLVAGRWAPAAEHKPPAADKKAAAKALLPPVDRAAREEAIRDALSRPIQMEFVETPLSDVVAYLSDTMQIPIVLDRRAMEAVGVEPDNPVTFTVRDVSARSALELLLQPLQLDFMIAHEVLLITIPDQTDSNLTTRVYDVADLVLARNEKDQVEADFDSLIDVITSTVKPTAWDLLGGPGSLTSYNVAAPLLVVSQTERVHEQIEGLLAAMRAASAKKLPSNPPKRIPDATHPEPKMGMGSTYSPAPECHDKKP